MTRMNKNPYPPQVATGNKALIMTIRRLCADGTALYEVTECKEEEKTGPFVRVRHNPDRNDFSILESHNKLPKIEEGDEMLLVTETLGDGTFRITY